MRRHEPTRAGTWNPRSLRRIAIGVASLTTLAAAAIALPGQVSVAAESSSVVAEIVGNASPIVSSPSTSGRSYGGAAFAMTNRSSRNQIVTYRRAPNGALTRVGRTSTRGTGIGTDLDTQGALRLSRDNRFLYATNAGSDNITVFAVHGPRLTFLQKVYAGDQPNSLTLHGDLLYALNGSVAGNGIRGFNVADNGTLAPLKGSVRLLSSPIAVPGQVEFSPNGRLLLVTQKTTNVQLSPPNAIDVFRVNDRGLPSALPKREASHGLRPFSLAFSGARKLLVVEAFNAAPAASAVSSYNVSGTGNLDVISGSVRNRQTDACWIVVSRDGHDAFTANFGSGTISSYRVATDGPLRLRDGNAAFLGIDSQPVDLALRPNANHLYLLLRGTGGVATFRVRDDGSLSPRGIVTGGLPVADGASGLAVY